MMTHSDSASTAACLSFVSLLWNLLQMDSPPAPAWWLETYVGVARDLEVDEGYCPRGGRYGYKGPEWRSVRDRVAEGHRRGWPVVEACNSWYSGAYLLDE
jgi:ADP-ribosyl-[dinitrogen reductase] hydrolase